MDLGNALETGCIYLLVAAGGMLAVIGGVVTVWAGFFWAASFLYFSLPCFMVGNGLLWMADRMIRRRKARNWRHPDGEPRVE